MCGIWCFFGRLHADDRLMDVSHRGPDDQTCKIFQTQTGELQMAHWRLSILDLTPLGRQPMAYAGGRYQIVFNGEIYNYCELREELQRLGCSFLSDGDTEVILAAYHLWGEECLARLLGMFAFCLWDRERQTLFVARDRFGIKPLYYFISKNGVAFASEIKQFGGLADFRPKANLRRVGEFLIYGAQDHTAETMWDGVHQLRGGECALIDLKESAPQTLPVRSWYRIGSHEEFGGTFEEASQRYRELFYDVIRLHLRSDVPVGSCLSGGMDSSAIVCTMNRLLRDEASTEIQNTFSCVFEEPECDERPFMRSVEEFTGVKAHHIFPQPGGVFESLKKLVWHQDEPVHNASVFAQNELFCGVKQAGVKVMLDGQGGDEQLASYPQFFAPHLAGMLSRGRIVAAAREFACLRKFHNWGMGNFAKGLVHSFFPQAGEGSAILQNAIRKKQGWLNLDFFAGRGIVLQRPWSNEKIAVGKATTAATVSRLMLQTTTIPMLLHWEDRNAMAHGVEARVPFLDHRLVEFTLGLPDEFKTRGGETKRILKSAMKDSMPEKVLKRTDKKGFATPEERWLKREPGFREKVLAAAHNHPQLFSRTGLENELNLVLQDRKPFSNLFWRVITLDAWAGVFGIEF